MNPLLPHERFALEENRIEEDAKLRRLNLEHGEMVNQMRKCEAEWSQTFESTYPGPTPSA